MRGFKSLPWLVAAGAVILVAVIALQFTGFVTVRDQTGIVKAALITDGSSKQPLHRLPGGLFVGIPRLEGVVRIECRDGTTDERAYVTARMQTDVTVTGQTCHLQE